MPTALLLTVLAATPLSNAELVPPPREISERVALATNPALPPATPTSSGGTAASSIGPEWTPITSLPFTITTPGGYYLAANLSGVSGSHGITVAQNDVVFDLNGFRIAGVFGSLDGIHANANVNRVRVRNGFVISWGQDGVDMAGIDQAFVEALTVVSSGGAGIVVGPDSRVFDCQSISNGLSGVVTGLGAIVERCNASRNDGDGFSLGQRAIVSGCHATLNDGDGIEGNQILVQGCEAQANQGHGVFVLNGGRVSGSVCSENLGDGIRVGPNATVSENVCNQNGFGAGDGAGIRSTATGCRIEANHVVANDRGIEASSGNCLVVRNSALVNGTNYQLHPGTSAGPILSAIDLAASSNPHANYSL